MKTCNIKTAISKRDDKVSESFKKEILNLLAKYEDVPSYIKREILANFYSKKGA